MTDLHMWSIGPNIYNLNISVVSQSPKPTSYYKQLEVSRSVLQVRA